MKRVVTIQDFSCVGRCSLTAALPVISAAGVECCAIPTAVLSNHTGFSSFYSRDLTEEIAPISDMLASLGIAFDALYTGYMASSAQMEIICGFIERFAGGGALVFVDPVMGDNGRLYAALTPDYPEKMRALCARADIIAPNLTEACMLTGREYIERPCGDDFKRLLKDLAGLGARRAVITGAFPEDRRGLTGVMGLDGAEFFGTFTPREDLACSGTGDIFASALLGAYMRGQSLTQAAGTAVKFTYRAVELTKADPCRREYGVGFEAALPYYIELLGG